jgi:hypothetical protein
MRYRPQGDRPLRMFAMPPWTIHDDEPGVGRPPSHGGRLDPGQVRALRADRPGPAPSPGLAAGRDQRRDRLDIHPQTRPGQHRVRRRHGDRDRQQVGGRQDIEGNLLAGRAGTGPGRRTRLLLPMTFRDYRAASRPELARPAPVHASDLQGPGTANAYLAMLGHDLVLAGWRAARREPAAVTWTRFTQTCGPPRPSSRLSGRSQSGRRRSSTARWKSLDR